MKTKSLMQAMPVLALSVALTLVGAGCQQSDANEVAGGQSGIGLGGAEAASVPTPEATDDSRTEATTPVSDSSQVPGETQTGADSGTEQQPDAGGTAALEPNTEQGSEQQSGTEQQSEVGGTTASEPNTEPGSEQSNSGDSEGDTEYSQIDPEVLGIEEIVLALENNGIADAERIAIVIKTGAPYEGRDQVDAVLANSDLGLSVATRTKILDLMYSGAFGDPEADTEYSRLDPNHADVHDIAVALGNNGISDDLRIAGAIKDGAPYYNRAQLEGSVGSSDLGLSPASQAVVMDVLFLSGELPPPSLGVREAWQGIVDPNDGGVADISLVLTRSGFTDAEEIAVALKAGAPYSNRDELAVVLADSELGLSDLTQVGVMSVLFLSDQS